jgi:hypothetical protein
MACIPEEYIDCHKGQTCIVMGDGPSIGDYDLTDPFFTENITFGCNRIGRRFTPTYYLISDPAIYPECVALVQPPSILLRGQYAGTVPECNNIVYYKQTDLVGPPTKGRLYFANKSGPLMLHIAYQMGFDMYFVLGIDGYNTPGKEHFYSTEETVGRANREDSQEALFELFAVGLAEECKQVWNLSSRSVFTSFPRCDLATAKAIRNVRSEQGCDTHADAATQYEAPAKITFYLS